MVRRGEAGFNSPLKTDWGSAGEGGKNMEKQKSENGKKRLFFFTKWIVGLHGWVSTPSTRRSCTKGTLSTRGLCMSNQLFFCSDVYRLLKE